MSDEEKKPIDWLKLDEEWRFHMRSVPFGTRPMDAYNKFWEDRGGKHRYFHSPDTPEETPKTYQDDELSIAPPKKLTDDTMSMADPYLDFIEEYIKLQREWFGRRPLPFFDPQPVKVLKLPSSFRVQVLSNFSGAMALDWVTVRETGLRLLLRRVCGASDRQCDEFLDKFDHVTHNTFNGVDGQEDLSYTLIAIHGS